MRVGGGQRQHKNIKLIYLTYDEFLTEKLLYVCQSVFFSEDSPDHEAYIIKIFCLSGYNRHTCINLET